MMLQTFRQWGKALIYLDLMVNVAWAVAAVTVGTLMLVLLRLGPLQTAELAVSIALGAAFLGFLAWMTWDAQRSFRTVHREHRRLMLRPECPMADAVGLPVMPPWMGVL